MYPHFHKLEAEIYPNVFILNFLAFSIVMSYDHNFVSTSQYLIPIILEHTRNMPDDLTKIPAQRGHGLV